LSKFGYKNVDVCYDGNQAVEAAEKTQYDLMLMDLQVSIHSAFPLIPAFSFLLTLLQMPNMDGHTARRLISENANSGNPMVVALTANCDQV
jgi:CheY-like chemotaxis protein